jgi:pentose-5-phosphate-3-epimerase
MAAIEIVPAILRKTYEKIEEDWQKIYQHVSHIQLDITDGIFAGDGTFRELRRFKQLPQSQKIELHMMVHTPSNFVEGICDLNPARCIFHIESFSGTGDLTMVYEKLREATQTELALAINPQSPNEWLDEQIGRINYVLFMGYNPGWANQPLNPIVYKKIVAWRSQHPEMPIAVDGHVSRETIPEFVTAGATILCANTAIFGEGNPIENTRQLQLLAESAITTEV